MLIDWFTVFAQIVNFLILIFLLKRFLYGPILAAMERRENRIAEQLRRAGEEQRAAEQQRSALASRQRQLELDREQMMLEARAEVEQWRETTLEKVKEEVAGRRREWLDAIDREKELFRKQFKDRLNRLVFSVSDKVLSDLADSSLESQLVDTFVHRLQTDGVADHRPPVGRGSKTITVTSGFELPGAQQEKVKAARQVLFPDSDEPIFEVRPEMGLGLTLVAGDRKVEWSLAGYLADIEEDIVTGIGETPGGEV